MRTKDESCGLLETILLEMKHLHAKHHANTSTFAPTLKFDSDTVFVSHGWTQLMSEPCIYYVYGQDGIFAMIGIYVDDLPLARKSTQWVVEFKRTLGQRFKIKDLGDLKKLLGMHITRDRVVRTVSID
jgi:hypothetical protein